MEQAAVRNRASYPGVYRHLMAVGLLGSIYRTHDDANAVSTAVEATLKDARQFRMYRAIAQGIGGDSSFATETLGMHVEQNPDDDSAKVAMAVAMMLAGDPEWKPIIDKVLATSIDQVAREAAVSVLNYLMSLTRH